MEKVKKTEAEWKAELSPEQYKIVREKGTEAPFTSELNDEKSDGTFKCVAGSQSYGTLTSTLPAQSCPSTASASYFMSR